MLLFVRQEGKQVLGDALVELMAGHLNADIVGSLDNFVSQAAGKLKGILAEAAPRRADDPRHRQWPGRPGRRHSPRQRGGRWPSSR
jgi:hypothetical protein